MQTHTHTHTNVDSHTESEIVIDRFLERVREGIKPSIAWIVMDGKRRMERGDEVFKRE